MATLDDLRKRIRPDQATRRVAESSVPPVVLPQAPAPQPGVGQAEARVGIAPTIVPPSVAAQQVVPAPQQGVGQAEARAGVQPQVAQPQAQPQQAVPVPPQGVDQATARAGVPQATQQPVAVGAQTSPQVQQPQAVPTQPAKPFYSAFMEQIKKSQEPYKPMTDKEIEDEKRKRRSQASFAALGDALSSLASLYGTTRGALPVFDPSNALSPRQLERADKLKLEKEGDRDKWMQYEKMKFDLEAAKEQQDYVRGKAEQERADRLAALEADRKERAEREKTRKQERAEDLALRGKERAEDAGERAEAREQDWKKFWAKLAADKAEGKAGRESAERIAKTRSSGSGSLTDAFTDEYRKIQISEVFDMLPEEVRKRAGKPIIDPYDPEHITGYETPTIAEQMKVVGEYANKNAEYRKEVEKRFRKAYKGGESDDEDYGPFDTESKDKLTEGEPDI